MFPIFPKTLDIRPHILDIQCSPPVGLGMFPTLWVYNVPNTSPHVGYTFPHVGYTMFPKLWVRCAPHTLGVHSSNKFSHTFDIHPRPLNIQCSPNFGLGMFHTILGVQCSQHFPKRWMYIPKLCIYNVPRTLGSTCSPTVGCTVSPTCSQTLDIHPQHVGYTMVPKLWARHVPQTLGVQCFTKLHHP